jgi:colicin import membrane protein
VLLRVKFKSKPYEKTHSALCGILVFASWSARGKAAEKKATSNKAKKLTAAEEKENIKESTLSKAAEKKVKDKINGTYKGRKVYTGPRGGKYYINKNGNKTYIDSECEE